VNQPYILRTTASPAMYTLLSDRTVVQTERNVLIYRINIEREVIHRKSLFKGRLHFTQVSNRHRNALDQGAICSCASLQGYRTLLTACIVEQGNNFPASSPYETHRSNETMIHFPTISRSSTVGIALPTDWIIQGSELESQQGHRPDRLWGPFDLLSNGNRGSFPGDKAKGS
jgi:hypothetical protein